MASFVTVGQPVADGWECVGDDGIRRLLPRSALDPQIVYLRVGQRLRVHLDQDQISRARLP
ncbi:MAG: hypothetical protein ACK5LN_14575 [Propioniciclava sp.]